MDYELIYGSMGISLGAFFVYNKIKTSLKEGKTLDAKAEETGSKCMKNILAIAHHEAEKEKWNGFSEEEIKKLGVDLSPPKFYDKMLFQRYLKKHPDEKARFERDCDMYRGMLRLRQRDIEFARVSASDAECTPIG